MEDLGGKAVNGSLPNTEWNGRADEVQQVVEAFAALSGTGGDNQLEQAIAAYAAASQFYTCTGPADAYVATVLSGIQAPPDYVVGMTVRISPSAANTGASTINVATLGVRNIKREDGSALQVSDIITTRNAWMIYDGTDFLLSDWSSSVIVTATAASTANVLVGQLQWDNVEEISFTPGIGGNSFINIDGVILSRSSDLVFHFDDFGVGGSHLDTGTMSVSTPYYLFIENVAGVMTPHISVTAPILPLAGGKVGYHPTSTDWRCIGGFWNGPTGSGAGNGDITKCVWVNNRVELVKYVVDHGHDVDFAASASWSSAININIPVTALDVHMHVTFASAGTQAIAFGKGDASTNPTDRSKMNDANSTDVIAQISITASDFMQQTFTMPIVNLADPEFKVHNFNDDVTEADARIMGWTDAFAPKL